MKISIVVSTYNGEDYLDVLMDSLFKQLRKADEVLFFDDKSSDNTVGVIRRFINEHELNDSWKVSINARNKGWKKNFMEGLWQASGDLVFPCDQDDIWKPEKLKEMEDIMIRHQEIDVLTSNYEAFYDSGKTKIGPVADDGKIVKQDVVQNIFETKYPGCTYCIRKRIINLSKNYWELDFPHDALFWRMGMFSNTLYSYNKSLIKWRKHTDSAYALESIQLKSNEKKREWLSYALRVIKSLMRFVKEQKVINQKQKAKILLTTQKWIETRIAFFDTKNFLYWLKLIKYIKCYDRLKQYIGDLYLVYFRN